MNAHITGKRIAQKRKEKNLTQEQLGKLLHVSNKTISKWEAGRCMPDYTLVSSLCRELDITPGQLLTGEKQTDSAGEAQVLDLLRRTQALEKQRTGLFGLVLIVMGISLMTVSQNLGAPASGIFSPAWCWACPWERCLWEFTSPPGLIWGNKGLSRDCR